MSRFFVVAIGLTLSLTVLSGCGGGASKGVNQDKDRPRTAETRK